jgi:molybdopterin-synthase adenylyltransferase
VVGYLKEQTVFDGHLALRYSRQMMVEGFGPEAQERLYKAKVLAIGAGGLGSPALMYLAAAGVGTIGIADYDSVEPSNLHRQILYAEEDIGQKKTESARRALEKRNRNVRVVVHDDKISQSNAPSIVGNYDFIIHATDLLSGKFILNDICVVNNKPFSHAGVSEFGGQILSVIPHASACLRCIFGSPDPETLDPAAQAGILGPVAGVIGTLQAMEAIKFIVKTGNLLTDTVLFFDGRLMEFRKTKISRNSKCPVCGNNP